MSIFFVKSCSSEICIDGSNLHSVRARESSQDAYSCLCLQRVSPQLLISSVGRSETTHITTPSGSYGDRVNLIQVNNTVSTDNTVFSRSGFSERACVRPAQH